MTAYGWRATSNNTQQISRVLPETPCRVLINPVIALADIPELPINVRFRG